MQTNYPDTIAKRRAGMAQFRARSLSAYQRILANGEVKGKDADHIRDLIETIKATQQKFGEV